MRCVRQWLCLLGVCLPLTLYATQTTAYYNPLQSPDNNAASDSVTLNGGMFGLQGPFSLSTTYSENYGVILNGQYTFHLGERNAASVLLEGGTQAYRLNLTWGLLLSRQQRLKITAERLAQKMDFDFAAGKANRWVGQNALGASYQWLLQKGWLRAMNVTGFLSKAGSENLSAVNYFTETDEFRNDRHIAGGSQESLQAGLSVLPSQWTSLDANLGYQTVRYAMRYQAAADNSRGLTYNISLHQLLNDHLKLNLNFTHDQTQNTTDGGMEVLLPSPHGTGTDLQLDVKRILGRNGATSDTQYTAGLTFRWGASDAGKLSIAPAASLQDLASWVAQPAVRMNQVLAVKDERSLPITQRGPPALSRLAATPKTVTIEVNPQAPVVIDVAPYLPAVIQHSSQAKMLTVEGLPSSLQYDAAREKITGRWPVQTAGKPATPAQGITLQVVLTPDANAGLAGLSQQGVVGNTTVLQVKLAAAASWLYVNPQGPKSYTDPALKQGQPFSHTFFLDASTPNTQSLFINGFATTNGNDIKSVTFSGLDGTGITCGHLNRPARQFTCQGTPTKSGAINMSITDNIDIFNIQGSATLNNFTFNVTPSSAPPKRNTKAAPTIAPLAPGASFPAMDYRQYYDNDAATSGVLQLSDTDTNLFKVTYQPMSGAAQTTTLKASLLGQDKAADNHFLTITNGSVLSGSLPSNAPAGSYTLWAQPKNTIGSADTPMQVTMVVQGKPVITGQPPSPAALTKNGGDDLGVVQFSGAFTNPPQSGAMTLDAAATAVKFQPPNGDFGAPVAFADSDLAKVDSQNQHLSLVGTALQGTIPTSVQQGTYVVMVKAKNTVGTSAEVAEFTLTINAIPGAPVYTGQAGTSQTKEVGQAIDTIDLGAPTATSYFSNPPNSGERQIETQATMVSFTNLAGQTHTTSLNASNLKTLTVSGLQLSGVMPADQNDAGTYKINFRVKNAVGTSTAGPEFTLNVNPQSAAPIYQGGANPATQALLPDETMNQIDFGTSQYYINPPNSGTMLLHGDNKDSVGVQYQSPTDASPGPMEALTASHLNGGIQVSGDTPTALTGKVPSTAAPGTYFFTLHMANTAGKLAAGSGPTWTLQVKGVPIANGGTPAQQTRNAGDAIAEVDYHAYFVNPPASELTPGVPFAIDPTDSLQIRVASTSHSDCSGLGAPQALASSPLGAASGESTYLSITNQTTLSGGVPDNAPAGCYRVSVQPKNGVGLAQLPVNFDLQVATTTGVPQYNQGTTGDQILLPGNVVQAINFGDNAFYSNPPNSGVMTLDPADASQLQVNFTGVGANPETQTTSLAASYLGQQHENSGYVGVSDNTLLSGHVPQQAKPGTYVLQVHMHNDKGTATAGPTLTVYVQGVPILNPESPNPDNVTLSGGASFTQGFDLFFLNPPHSGTLSLSTMDLSQVAVRFKPVDGSFGAPQTLSDSSLGQVDAQGNHLTTVGNSITGQVPGNAPQGLYEISVHAHNAVGTAVSASVFTLTVNENQGIPVWQQVTPDTQAVLPGEAIHTVDYQDLFLNPSHSGALQLSADDPHLLRVVYKAPGAGSVGAPTSLQASFLGEAVNLTGEGGLTLAGTVPQAAPPGTYIIHATPKNTIGIAASGPAFELQVKGAPILKSGAGTPAPLATLTVGTGQALPAPVAFDAFYDNPPASGEMSLDAGSQAQLTVAYTPIGSPSPTQVSSLSDSHLHTLALSNGQLSGVVASDVGIEGTYVLTAHMANVIGIAQGSVPLTLQVSGVPLYDTASANPPTQTVLPGHALSAVDLTDNFKNPPGGGVLHLVPDDVNAIAVEYKAPGATDFSAPQALSASVLGGGVTPVGARLQGEVPADAPAGSYRLTMHLANDFGIAASSAPTADGPQFVLQVPSVPVWDGTTPSVSPMKPGDSLSQMINFAPPIFQNTPGGGEMHLAADKVNILGVAYKAPGADAYQAPTSLNDSALAGGITLTSSGADYRDMGLTGSIPSTAAPGSYQLMVRAANDQGVSATGPDTVLVIQGPPVRNAEANPPPQSAHLGATMNSMVLANYFANPDDSGNLSLSRQETAQLQVTFKPATGGAAQTTSLDNSHLKTLSLGQDGQLILSGTLPDDILAAGEYDLTVHAANTIGQSTGALQFTLMLVSPPVRNDQPDPATTTISPTDRALPTIDYATYYTNPAGGGALRVDPSDLSSLQVNFQPVIGPAINGQTLEASALHGSFVVSSESPAQLTPVSGQLAADVPPGVYTIIAHLENANGGVAPGATSWQLVVPGVPQANNQTPGNQSLNGGDPIAAVDYGADYYVNPAGAGPMGIDPQNASEASVTFTPASGGPASTSRFSDSALAQADGNGHQLSFSHSRLSGVVPAQAAPGQYVITVAPSNNFGIAKTARAWTLSIVDVPHYNGKVPGGDGFFKAGESFMPGGESLDLSQYFSPNQSLWFSGENTHSICVLVDGDTACKTLNASGSQLFYNQANRIISGQLALANQTATATNYTLKVYASVDQKQFSADPFVYQLTVLGPPVRNDAPNPSVTGLPNTQMVSMGLANYFNNDDRHDNGLRFDLSAHPDQVWVTDPSGQQRNFTDSALYDGGQGLTIDQHGNLSGRFAGGLAAGQYLITAHAYNSVGESQVGGPKGAPAGTVQVTIIVKSGLAGLNPCPTLQTVFHGDGSGNAEITADSDPNHIGLLYHAGEFGGIAYQGVLMNTFAGVTLSWLKAGGYNGNLSSLQPDWAEINGNTLTCTYAVNPGPQENDYHAVDALQIKTTQLTSDALNAVQFANGSDFCSYHSSDCHLVNK